MDYILATALSYLLLYKYVAFLTLIFLGSFILPLPDNLILLATGAFASQGIFNFPLTIILAIVVAMASDILGYVLTRKYGIAVLKMLHIKESHVTKVHRYVNDYTGITIFITRIAGPFGPAVNFLAGFLKVSWQKFLLFDFLGNLVDIVVYMVAGYILGNYWLDYSGQIGTIVAVLGSAILIIFVVIHLYNNRKKIK